MHSWSLVTPLFENSVEIIYEYDLFERVTQLRGGKIIYDHTDVEEDKTHSSIFTAP
jgi:hypothetical protein